MTHVTLVTILDLEVQWLTFYGTSLITHFVLQCLDFLSCFGLLEQDKFLTWLITSKYNELTYLLFITYVFVYQKTFSHVG